jgi:hypothetical protein
MIYADTIRIDAWFDLLDWFKITSEIFLQMIDRKFNNDKIFESFVSFSNSKSKEVNIMSRTTVNRMKLLSSDAYD